MTQKLVPARFALVCAALAIAASAHAHAWRFATDAATGALTSDLDLSAPIPGTVIGDYDAVKNPGGTQTRPGLFGGSGNNPIDFDITLQTAGQASIAPEATFVLTLDPKTQSAELRDFAADLLPQSPLALDLTLQLLYSSFHTINPTAVFPGGVTIPLPLGQISVTTLTLQQTGASLGALVETNPGEYSLTVAASVDATIEASAFGQTFTFGPVPVPLALSGTVMLMGNHAMLTLAPAITFNQTLPGPFPGGAFADVPLDVPTVLPPGATAHLLFSGELESLTLAFDLGGTLELFGYRLGDVDLNGAVNIDDLLAVISAWGPCPAAPGACPADMNGDGVVDVHDLFTVGDNWG